MSYSVFTLRSFDKQLKRLVKKYPSLKNEYIDLIDSLENNPEQGTALGNRCYKIRLAISSKRKGKSGGARVIAHLVVEDDAVYLLAIYDKSQRSTLTDAELTELLKQVAG
ncbi:type II toxin-antitoxin system RelE/ParE family toxin [Sphingobacterium sp. lm-10]|uniref:type II toxin-antitoxin system RelE/ParE family toxin n=1 Tax=Sphingobacterium sp. lm-10 TaxID=2944904 RepID=UPI002021325D|nr:type II toxin-antitoxin system RelE/ParE family toxin [Sphingobacterium sp. lm-10]MCL7988567.1 type II toxin-antitoxin system RelE/ParE family toxin [Sphingobacterium sp. lm-10]